jgi:hypothetical protein
MLPKQHISFFEPVSSGVSAEIPDSTIRDAANIWGNWHLPSSKRSPKNLMPSINSRID